MNGLEMKGPCFGCDVYGGAGNNRVASINKEGETCEVELLNGEPATLCSLGPRQGFYILSPLKLSHDVERNYYYSVTNNSYLRLASGGFARAT